MKKIYLLFILASTNVFAQTWNTTGNAGTNSTTNFLGTTDNKDLILKTNGLERLKFSSTGSVFFNLSTLPGSDGIDIVSNTQNLVAGTDIVWIKSSHTQVNDIGLLTLSNAIIWQNPVFSARENGKIFIGTTASNYTTPNCSDCNNYRLFVKDGIRTEKVKVDVASTNGWADYVFKNDYILPTLGEVEKHIKENGHLPNIPSAEEIMKDGLNLGEMEAKLLQKIEELTLYTIDQNKQIQELQKDNKALKSQSSKIDELEKMLKAMQKAKSRN